MYVVLEWEWCGFKDWRSGIVGKGLGGFCVIIVVWICFWCVIIIRIVFCEIL